jgi:hypothetical protein
MHTYKMTARIVGVLFIVATAAAILGGVLLLVIEEPLVDVSAAEGQVVSGALLELVLAISVVGIAVMLFPVLKKNNEGMALGYVGGRIFEGVLILAATVSALTVLTLSQDYGQAGVAGVQPLADLLVATREWTYFLGTMVVFSLTALILNSLLYQSKLVPTWLSLWGFAGGALLLVRALLEMFGQELSGAIQALFVAPIAINEMVLAVWLIVKGFNATALASEAEKELPLTEITGTSQGTSTIKRPRT